MSIIASVLARMSSTAQNSPMKSFIYPSFLSLFVADQYKSHLSNLVYINRHLIYFYHQLSSPPYLPPSVMLYHPTCDSCLLSFHMHLTIIRNRRGSSLFGTLSFYYPLTNARFF